MEILNAIVGKILELTVQPIEREVGYLFSYHSNVKTLKDKLKELQNDREVVQHLVDDAIRQGEVIEAKVQTWFSTVNGITELAETLCTDESHANTKCSCNSCPNLWLRHQISRKAKKMKMEIEEIMGKGKFDRVAFYKHSGGLPSTSIIHEGMESRISIMNRVLEALEDDDTYMVGLCGLPGAGKTTLAKKIAIRAKEHKLFDEVVWVTVAQNPNLTQIQTQIADSVGMRLIADSVNVRASHLVGRLKREKSLLVVLDDLWERLDLDEVGIPFDEDVKRKNIFRNENDKSCICKILFTSRNEELLSNQMSCKRNIKVGEMFEEEAWELFKKTAELSDESNTKELLSLATEVFQQCGRLPLAIVAVSKAMRNKRKLGDWRDALRRLKNPLRRNMTGIKEIDESLKFSYDHLTDELQSIFLLSAMLSHDPLITDLLMYSTGLSLLRGVHSMNEAQDALHALISKLKASSLLLDSFSIDHFTMHDVFREFALSVAFEKQGAVVVRHKDQNDLQSKTLLKDCTRLCLDKSGITQLPDVLDCPRLEFFLIRGENLDLGIPSTFFRSTKELKVMSIFNIHFECLPSSVSHLQKLRTLSLHSCLLKDIAEVGNLNNLTILSLVNSDIQQLPCELAGLTCLQMLNLAHCSKLKVIPPKLLSSLRRLEVLDMTDSFNRWKAEGSSNKKEIENASLSELKDLTSLSSLNIHIPNTFVLPKDLFLHSTLERYDILIGESWEWSVSSGECETSKTLKLKLRSNIHLEHGIQKLLDSVEDLHIDELNDIINVFYDLHGEGFPHLKHLKIENIDQIEYIVSHSSCEVFPNLETLNLLHLNGLKKLCQGWIMAASFKSLRKINVDGCDQLKSIFSSLTVGSFCQLVELQIKSCKSIEGIVVFTNEGSSDHQRTASDVIVFQQLSILRMSDLPMLSAFCLGETATNTEESKRKLKSLFGSEISFPKLETVELRSINSEQLWDHRLQQNAFRNLKRLIVKDCPFLVKLVPLHVLRSLCRLEEMDVSDCSSLEIVFDFEELNGNNKEIQLPSCVVPLKTLKIVDCRKLKHVWSNDPKEMVSFPSLRRVDADYCESLKSMFPASIAKGLLQLERLHLFRCGVDVIVAKDEKVSESDAATFVFPKLTYLRLHALRNLRNFYPYGHMSEWPQLQHLVVGDCDGLEIFQKEVSSSSTLQEDAQEIKYPLLLHEKVIPNLMKLNLGGKHGVMIWNGQFPAYHFHKVQHLCVELDDSTTFPYGLNNNSFPNLQELEFSWGYMKELKFSSVEPIGDDVGQVALAPITTLTLWMMLNLKHIWNENSELHFILPNLQSINVSFCGNLINLGPSFISFDNLTDISVSYCERLINLMTSSTSRSLVQLTRLEISECERIEEIITKQEGEDDVEKKIVFQKLRYLRLEHLKSLRSFCSHCYTLVFPSLQEVTIEECGRMSMFCPGNIHTPLLKGVAFGKKKEDEEDQKLWDTNLNKTVQLRLITQLDNLFNVIYMKICMENQQATLSTSTFQHLKT